VNDAIQTPDFGAMEQLAVLGMRPEQVLKLTEQDAANVFSVGAANIPEDTLFALCRRFPQQMFRNTEGVPEALLRVVSEEYPNLALTCGCPEYVPSGILRELLLNNPDKIRFLSGIGHSAVDEPFVEQLAKIDPVAVLRYASKWSSRQTLAIAGIEQHDKLSAVGGYAASYWSSFALQGPLPHNNLRLFTTPLGQCGQGWPHAQSYDLTNLKESSRLTGLGTETFCVERVTYTLENVGIAVAEDIARTSVLSFDMVQAQIDIGVLSDFQHPNGDLRRGSYCYPRVAAQAESPAGQHSYGERTGPFVLPTNSSFAVLLRFGTHAPVMPPLPSFSPSSSTIPYIRITLMGRTVPEPVRSGPFGQKVY